jgi:PPOX class probable F420-dependent enzyme
MTAIPEKYHSLLTSKALAQLATLMPDGSPQLSPVWFDYDGEHIRINTAVGRLKDRNMRRDPRVAISIVDPNEPERALNIRGRVVEISEDANLKHMHGLTRRYRGDDWTAVPGQIRVIYKIRPEHVFS